MSRPRDLSPEAEKVLIDLLRQKTFAEKFQMMVDMNRFVAELQLAEIRRNHPAAGEHELRMRLGSRWIDKKLMKAAYGWDVDVEGY